MFCIYIVVGERLKLMAQVVSYLPYFVYTRNVNHIMFSFYLFYTGRVAILKWHRRVISDYSSVVQQNCCASACSLLIQKKSQLCDEQLMHLLTHRQFNHSSLHKASFGISAVHKCNFSFMSLHKNHILGLSIIFSFILAVISFLENNLSYALEYISPFNHTFTTTGKESRKILILFHVMLLRTSNDHDINACVVKNLKRIHARETMYQVSAAYMNCSVNTDIAGESYNAVLRTLFSCLQN